MLKQVWLFLWLVCLPLFCVADNAVQPLPADQAFKISAQAQDPHTVAVSWQIQPGYYLYRDHFHFSVVPPQSAVLGNPIFPPGISKTNEILGNYVVYKNTVTIHLPVSQTEHATLRLKVNYQGCSEDGFCYPPIEKVLTVSGLKSASSMPWTFWLGLFGIGILIAFTPCVLPMIPVLSALIVGRETLSHARAFLISFIYVLAMALTYAVIGLLFGWLGGNLQIYAQKPWIIILLGLFFLVMALSLFGLFHLEPPEKIRTLMSRWSSAQHRGSLWGAGIMGVLSTLILSPCATPPLVAAIGFIAHKGEPIQGAIALFIMGLGMGIPLLIIGLVGRRFLPKPGPWMNGVKYFLGIVLIALAIWMVSRIADARLVHLLWAALMIGVAIALKTFNTTQTVKEKIGKGVGIILFICGVLLVASSFEGSKINRASTIKTQKFIPVKTVSDVQNAFAHYPHQFVVLDFYADWCVSCKLLEQRVFANPQVQQAMQDVIWLRADVTANDAQDQQLLKYYQVVAPPTLLFFNVDHIEVSSLRLIGGADRADFLKKLQTLHQ